MVPAEVLPSPQLIVAVNSLAGSTPLAWVKLATLRLFTFFDVVVMGADMTIGGSGTVVLAVALLFDGVGSAEVAVTEAVVLTEGSSVTLTVTVKFAVPPPATIPRLKVTTPPDWLNVP